MNKYNSVNILAVKEFWNKNPLCASDIPHRIGTPEYFKFYDALREANESTKFSYDLHEYKDFKDKKVLDVGCGNGYVLSKYAIEGAETYGIDITETAVALCRSRFDLSGLKGGFRVANAEELPFEDGMFDCVCSMGVLHHTPDTRKAVSEIHRVLKPKGRLIVMFYHRHSGKYQIDMRLISLITGKSMRQLVNEVDGCGNPKGEVYSKHELRRLLADFREVKMFTRLLPGIGKLLPSTLSKAFENRYGWFLYAKGYK